MKIALIGYGKMGKAIEEIALKRGHEIALKIDADNLYDLKEEKLKNCDVAIEFTGPHSASENVMACINAAVPVVCGSTGWLQHWEKVKELCLQKNGGLLYASNFSIGVNIFFEINKKLAALMHQQPSYHVGIEEIHHTQKIDAPSGTAITLAEQIIKENPLKEKWVIENNGLNNEIVIASKRIDPAPGTHCVRYSSTIDDIEIIHTAHNRTGFAIGALLAAEFMASKKGIYSLAQVLGF